MKRKNLMLRCVFLVIVSLVTFPTMADMPGRWSRPTYTYHALSHAEWKVAQENQLKRNGVESERENGFGSETVQRMALLAGGVFVFFVCFVIVLFSKREHVITKVLMVLLFLALLLFLFLLLGRWVPSGNVAIAPRGVTGGLHDDTDDIGGNVDITVDPNPGETYEEYLKRVRRDYQGYVYCPNCDIPSSTCYKHNVRSHHYCDRCGWGRCESKKCPKCGRWMEEFRNHGENVRRFLRSRSGWYCEDCNYVESDEEK